MMNEHEQIEMMRNSLIARHEQLLEQINQIFFDVNHWNTTKRKPGEAPIDADPDGSLTRLRVQLEENLKKLIEDA